MKLKKTFSLFLILVLSSVFLLSCGKDNTDKSDVDTLNTTQDTNLQKSTSVSTDVNEVKGNDTIVGCAKMFVNALINADGKTLEYLDKIEGTSATPDSFVSIIAPNFKSYNIDNFTFELHEKEGYVSANSSDGKIILNLTIKNIGGEYFLSNFEQIMDEDNANLVSEEPTEGAANPQEDTILIGSYVKFGTYRGQPIVWKCVDNSNGLMLVAEQMICLKAYDAAESGNYKLTSIEVQGQGSNKWENSNIREWLNSLDNKVKYTTQPPTEKAVIGYWYDDEPGFLTNFTQAERNSITIVNHDGVSDMVYLLSKEEANEFIPPHSKIKNTPQAIILERNENIDYGDNYFWTRTPFEKSAVQVWAIFGPDTSSSSTNVVSEVRPRNSFEGYGRGGVLPALNLKENSFKSGSGTLQDPYVIN
ncbi:DUF6273 domain-containing protein [Clostridium sp. YIM B02551]|uniref:DUF6273 domain-containing protein n=1 Tax=Clostridium sp. YIM B02551 TaxID=2910679 RepID=UPI001EEC5739|nr:DUF6273 domain-containing protein [Clostridium sp. YIM B02551]